MPTLTVREGIFILPLFLGRSVHARVLAAEGAAQVEGLHDRVVKTVPDTRGLGRIDKLHSHVHAVVSDVSRTFG